MPVKSPSKFTSLEKLTEALNNNNLSKGGADYSQEELKSLIRQKKALKIDRKNNELIKKVEQMENETIKVKTKVIKNVENEALKQFKILSIQRDENEGETFKFLVDYFLESEGLANKKAIPF